jgi:hypothetical protein
LKTRTAVLLVCCILAFVFISGCTMTGMADEKTHTTPADAGSQVTATPPATPTPAPLLGPEPEPILVSHQGSGLEKIHLEKGLAVFDMTYYSGGKCEVWLTDETVKLVQLYSVMGGYWGSKAVTIQEEDDYYLQASGDDWWIMQITQPRCNIAGGAPVSFTGAGQQVTEFFSLAAGPATFHITHDGQQDFNVWLFRNDGTRFERIASTYGTYDQSTTLNITNSGVYLLDIQASSRWKVDISQ